MVNQRDAHIPPYTGFEKGGAHYPSDKYIGDPDFQERLFTDTHGRPPPQYVPDAFTKRVRTQADVAWEESQKETTNGVVGTLGTEPGRSEFTWGKGLMVPLEMGPGPTQVEEAAAIRRTDSADPGAVHTDRYADWIREKVQDQ